MAARGTPEILPHWVAAVRAAVSRWCEGGLGARWVVAVSGGSDSVGMLRVMHALGPEFNLQLSVAHLDHGARGEASDSDARFVACLAEKLGLPFDLGHWRSTRSGHFEADARRARYDWLLDVARTRDASVVAVGHTCDDQAETILHRILRGTGPRGLAGMPARRPLSDSVTLVRPLIRTSRREIRDYLAAIGQDFRDDASNADLSRTRARIRHDLLPKLTAEYNPKVASALVRLGRLTGASYRALDRQIEKLAHLAIVSNSTSPDLLTLDCANLRDLPLILRAEVLRFAWRRQGWPEANMGANRWKRLASFVRRERGRFSIGGGFEVWSSGALLKLKPPPKDGAIARPSHAKLPLPGSVAWGKGRIVATFDAADPRDETIDLDRLDPLLSPRRTPYLSVAAPEDGDRFEPLGMDGKSMSLNDFLRGRRLPQAERMHVPLVVDKSGIVWVVGHRIAHRLRLTGATVRKLGLRWEPGHTEAAAPETDGPLSCD